MKIFFTFLSLLYGSLLLAQSAGFTRIENRIKAFVEKRQWDEIIMIAPDLIIEEPSRGEGFYYTSLAFLRLENLPKCEEYLKRAESMADAKLTEKIRSLKQDMAHQKQLQTSLNQIEQLANTGGSALKTAESWVNLWSMDKSNIEYGLNAVEIFVQKKEYIKALEILAAEELSTHPEAKALSDVINNTPEMRYNQAMTSGKKNYDKRAWQSALQNFEQALMFKSLDKSALDMKNKCQDEIAWENAKRYNTWDSYQEYIDGYTLKKYKSDALTAIDELAWKKAKRYNTWDSYQEYIDGYTLKKYKSDALTAIDELAWATAKKANSIESYQEYVNGNTLLKHRSEAISIVCQTWYNLGLSKAKEKNSDSQITAIQYFKETQQLCPDFNHVKHHIKKAQRLEKSYSRPDRIYLAYLYDADLPLGASIGKLKNRGTNFYASFQSNTNYFLTDEANFTVDNYGNTTGSVLNAKLTYNLRIGTAQYLAGLTQYVSFPFWLYAGVGLSHSKTWLEMDEYNKFGKYVLTEWVPNTDQNTKKVMGEFGLILNFGGFNIRAGLKTIAFNDWYPSIGAGFSFRN